MYSHIFSLEVQRPQVQSIFKTEDSNNLGSPSVSTPLFYDNVAPADI